jgi:hypothetical protein
MSSNVIRFRDYGSAAPRLVDVKDAPATVIMLPVVRIERHPELPMVDFVSSADRRNSSSELCGND